jgi:hypothetical protein
MFYHYSQNNSGGRFHYNKSSGITHHVIIEADSAKEADERGEGIGLYFDGAYDCPCCGNRWDTAWEGDGSKEPEVHGAHPSMLERGFKWMEPGYEVAVHYKDGKVEWF